MKISGAVQSTKGVKQSAMGFWYRVDYAGEGALAPTAVVDVVVKEKLTDGTVIQDMELSGRCCRNRCPSIRRCSGRR